MKEHPVQDLSYLPQYGYGSRSTAFWGTAGFMLIEGTGFALAAGTYLYLALVNQTWPLGAAPPGLLWSSLLTFVLVASVWMNQITKRHAEHEDLRLVRRDLVVMSVIGFVVLALRAMEFTTLGIRWDQNAYGSIVWVLLGLHTTHVLTDLGDTLVLTALMFTRHGRGKRFSDVSDNAVYWNFVVIAWLPIYALIYFAPRL
ncbi:MAG: putative cytochrome c oxidase subunit protein [Hyphomicrobiales bacterium]|nr:putative cytochrome c oxidase subunit protein [Hyphomicrobiales bacterium]